MKSKLLRFEVHHKAALNRYQPKAKDVFICNQKQWGSDMQPNETHFDRKAKQKILFDMKLKPYTIWNIKKNQR